MKRMSVVVVLALTAVSLTAAEKPRPTAEMKVDLVQDLHWKDHHFAMTNWFYKYKWKDPAAQIKMLAECGYNGAMLSLKDEGDRWKMLPVYLAALKKHDMALTAIHTRFYIEDGTYPKVVKDNLPLLKGSKVVFVPSVGSRTKRKRDDPKAVAMAVKILREMSADCEKFGLGGVAMYTHVSNWVETCDDSIRVAKAVDRRNVGTMFHLHHFQATGSKDLRGTLRRIKPYLMIVVLQGTNSGTGKAAAKHLVLGEGSFDQAALVRMLKELDYRGPLGTMGYTQSGDIPDKLKRGFDAWRRIKAEALGAGKSIYAKDNLVAWCIVPFDAKKRGPKERAEMLKRLGIKRLAYDWRESHVGTFEDEILALKANGIEFFAHWCSGGIGNPSNRKMLQLAGKHGIRPQMWMTMPSPRAASQAERVKKVVEALKPTVAAAKAAGCKVGLYNHGGWGGEPENLTAVAKHFREELGAGHVGIIYNFHHGHGHLGRFPKAFNDMVPYLLCVDLNGMSPKGAKILPLGKGTEDLKLLKMIRDSGYGGPIGILDHVASEDSEVVLRRNIEGLRKLLEQLGDTEALKTYP